MDSNLDLLLGDLELFPDCMLGEVNNKDEPRDIFKGSSQYGSVISATQDSIDDALPDWLDLKMDLSLLECLETTDTVLDDLLLDEVNNDQSLNSLPALQKESNTLPPLDLEQLSYEHSLVSKQPLLSEVVVCSPDTPPPSSPEWLVPDIGAPESPVSLFSPISEPSSPGYILTSSSQPSPAETTVLTFVAPIIQPIPVIDTSSVTLETQPMPLDNVLSLSFLLNTGNSNLQVEGQSDVILSEVSSTSSGDTPEKDEIMEKPKRERKRRGVSNPKASPSKMRVLKLPCESESESASSAPSLKKERKRKQNKDAAMRYRIKKRLETDYLAEEENGLLEENKRLTDKARQLSNELVYLKNLMREMFKAKGLLK